MSIESPSSREQIQKAHELLELIDNFSYEAAYGSYESSVKFLFSLVPSGQDEGPEIPVTLEILQALSPRERLGIKIAKNFCSDFNREFGWDRNEGSLLGWENEYLQIFFLNLGRTIQGILHKDGAFGQKTVECMVQANEAYINLGNWAEGQLTKSKA